MTTGELFYRFCKPGSVVNNHLSWTYVAARLFATREAAEQAKNASVGVAPDRVYMAAPSPTRR